MKDTYCDYCLAKLTAGREFIYQMESLQFIEDEEFLEFVRNMATYEGEPLRFCEACNRSIEKNVDAYRQDELDDDAVRNLSFWILIGGLLLLALLWAITKL